VPQGTIAGWWLRLCSVISRSSKNVDPKISGKFGYLSQGDADILAAGAEMAVGRTSDESRSTGESCMGASVAERRVERSH
jgi:hypothetical protein